MKITKLITYRLPPRWMFLKLKGEPAPLKLQCMSWGNI